MITKGIVEEVKDYKARVRLPIYDKVAGVKEATQTKDLYYATICSIANIDNPVSVGDIVYVSFEDNDNSKPIILGHLYRQNKSKSNSDINARLLTATSTTKLTKDTFIGDIKPLEIQMLKGLRGNIQSQFNDIKDDLDKNIDTANKEHKRLQDEIDDTNRVIREANLDNLVTVRSDVTQDIPSNKTFSGTVSIIGTAAAHKFKTRGISGSDESGLVDSALYLNYDSTDSLDAYKARPVYLGGSNDNSIAIRQDMLDNAINSAKSTLQKYTDEKISSLIDNAPEAYDTLKEIADWISSDKTGTAALVERVDTIESNIKNIENISSALLLGVCDTPAATANKEVTIELLDADRIVAGTEIQVKFTNAGIGVSSTLSVNGTTAYPLRAQYNSFNGEWYQLGTESTICKPGDTLLLRLEDVEESPGDMIWYIIENIDRSRRFQGALLGAPILYKNQSNQNTYQVWMGQSAFVLDNYFVSKFDNQSINDGLTVYSRYGNAFEIHTDGNGNVGLEFGRRDGLAKSAYIDFHTDGTTADFNSRIVASGTSLQIAAAGGVTTTGNLHSPNIYVSGTLYIG